MRTHAHFFVCHYHLPTAAITDDKLEGKPLRAKPKKALGSFFKQKQKNKKF